MNKEAAIPEHIEASSDNFHTAICTLLRSPSYETANRALKKSRDLFNASEGRQDVRRELGIVAATPLDHCYQSTLETGSPGSVLMLSCAGWVVLGLVFILIYVYDRSLPSTSLALLLGGAVPLAMLWFRHIQDRRVQRAVGALELLGEASPSAK